MNHQQVREIAEAAFKARFGDIGIVSINVKPGLRPRRRSCGRREDHRSP